MDFKFSKLEQNDLPLPEGTNVSPMIFFVVADKAVSKTNKHESRPSRNISLFHVCVFF